MRNTTAKLNCSIIGFRFSSNTNIFSQAMKMSRGWEMMDLFSFNYVGTSLSKVKRENKKRSNLYLVSTKTCLLLLLKFTVKVNMFMEL